MINYYKEKASTIESGCFFRLFVKNLGKNIDFLLSKQL